eukprot:3941974-Rhodomonas_salina.1
MLPPMRTLRDVQYRPPVRCYGGCPLLAYAILVLTHGIVLQHTLRPVRIVPIVLGLCYAKSGTDLGRVTTRLLLYGLLYLRDHRGGREHYSQLPAHP